MALPLNAGWALRIKIESLTKRFMRTPHNKFLLELPIKSMAVQIQWMGQDQDRKVEIQFSHVPRIWFRLHISLPSSAGLSWTNIAFDAPAVYGVPFWWSSVPQWSSFSLWSMWTQIRSKSRNLSINKNKNFNKNSTITHLHWPPYKIKGHQTPNEIWIVHQAKFTSCGPHSRV